MIQEKFEQLAQLVVPHKFCYATSKFDVGKIKYKLNLPLKGTAVFKKQRSTRIPLQLQEKLQHLLDILHDNFNIIAPVNTDSLITRNTIINPVKNSKKGESLKIVLEAGQLSTMIEETKCSSPIQLIRIILTRIKRQRTGFLNCRHE